jgi:hypothetical protein
VKALNMPAIKMGAVPSRRTLVVKIGGFVVLLPATMGLHSVALVQTAPQGKITLTMLTVFLLLFVLAEQAN